MSSQYQSIGLAMGIKELFASSRRGSHVEFERRRPTGLRELKRGMHKITAHDGVLSAGSKMDRDMACRMTRS